MLQAAAKDRGLYAAIGELVTGHPKAMFEASDDLYQAFLEQIEREAAKQAITERTENMILTLGEQGEREPAPEGPQPATCIEQKEREVVDPQYGPKKKIDFKFELDAKNSRGFPFVVVRSYNAVMSVNQKTGRKSDLRRDLDMWRGKPFTDEEIKAGQVRTEDFIQKRCILMIEHKPGNQGGIFAAVTAIMPIMQAVPPAEPPLAAALKASLKANVAKTKPVEEGEPY